jgi:cytochrome c oxidase cbb3-type subunit 3
MTRRVKVLALLALVAACDAPAPDHRATTTPLAASSWIGPKPGGSGDSSQLAVNPFVGDRPSIAQGYQYFKQFNCAGCHGDHGGGGMGPSLRDSSWYYGSSDPQVFASIYQGRDKGMPAWGTKLSAEQIWKLVSYIKSLRTANEPDPPQ